MKLKLDKNFKPCSVDAKDELYPNGIFVFNITRMIQFINENQSKFQLVRIDIESISNNISWACINEDHIDSVDTSIPIILAEISPEKFNIIDGNHRVTKAFRAGMKTIMAYRIYPKDHVLFLTTKKSYIKYVEYWNDKLLDL